VRTCVHACVRVRLRDSVVCARECARAWVIAGPRFRRVPTKYVRGSGSMSKGADSVTHTHGDTLTTLGNERERDATTPSPSPSPTEPSSLSPFSPTPTPPPLPLPPSPTATMCTGRRPRFGTGGSPPSPYVWIDGRQLRSALAWTKKRPPRRVSFPLSDSHLVTGYLEPDNPWRHSEYPGAFFPLRAQCVSSLFHI